MLKFNRRNFAVAILLLLIEIGIALFIRDQIIRPYIGDVLVVILIYYFIKSFLDTPVRETAIGVLLFAYTIETLQYFNIVKVLGLSEFKILSVMIGNYFSWVDILSYTAGFVMVLFIEKTRKTRYLKAFGKIAEI
ncbi:ribosomal maturation YjgA family protein [Pedobacter montanisoli]|uniref:DUF2809 domain-containing protein n=1 Tax=Pedobacter montanisoli TaxID=2923277 RepID=A0ABS9ZZN1_9SPHI|nr:DUF2809 domain-containing protein [Pedobacter montanisoli]MCJ0743773.1 DUF2809 domain-containing protein [Pedobacter montanisoli]